MLASRNGQAWALVEGGLRGAARGAAAASAAAGGNLQVQPCTCSTTLLLHIPPFIRTACLANALVANARSEAETCREHWAAAAAPCWVCMGSAA